MVDYREDIGKFYNIGKEIIVYRDEEDLVDKIHYYIANEDERKMIAERAYQKTLNEHLFKNRLNNILEIVEAHK